jgi:hypothetical protein
LIKRTDGLYVVLVTHYREGMELTLPAAPSGEETHRALAALEAYTRRPATSTLNHYDRFTRVFCKCGRHTFGPLNAAEFTFEHFVPGDFDEQGMYDEAFENRKWLLEDYEKEYREGDLAGRTASICSREGCNCPDVVNGEDAPMCDHGWCECEGDAALRPGHHRVLDLTRPFNAGDDDIYKLPLTGPVWKGDLPFCSRFVQGHHQEERELFLIKRTDGLFVYVKTRDCSATPDYRCSTSSTAVYWSADFHHLWNQCMTQGAREELWAQMTKSL